MYSYFVNRRTMYRTLLYISNDPELSLIMSMTKLIFRYIIVNLVIRKSGLLQLVSERPCDRKREFSLNYLTRDAFLDFRTDLYY